MAVHDGVPHVFGQILPWRVQVESHFVPEALEHMPVVFAGALGHAPGLDGVLVQRLAGVGNHQFRIDLELVADAGAYRAGAIGRVEGEGARFDLVEFELVPVRARALFREWLAPVGVVLVQIHEVRDDHALGKPQRGLDGIGQALADAVLDHQTVHHHFDGVLLLLDEFDVIGELPHLAVDQRAGVAVAAQQFEQVLELALPSADDGRQDLEPRAFRIFQQRVHHLLRRLGADQRAAFRAVRDAGAREQQAQVIVDLSDGADRRTRIAVRRLLVDGHGRAQAFDEVDVGFVHLPQKLPCIRGQ